MLVLIDGYHATGKAVLRGLLEGHPGLFVCPFHDMICDALCAARDDDWLSYRDIPTLRRLLAASYYHKMEWYARRGCMELDLSVKDRAVVPITLAFDRFDAQWMNELWHHTEWTYELILNLIFKALQINWVDYPYDGARVQNNVSMGFARATTLQNFGRRFPNGRMIYMTRKVEGIMATRANRKPVPGEMDSQYLAGVSVRSLLRNGTIQKVQMQQDAALAAQRKRPNRVKVVAFEDLIADHRNVMRDVAAFLEIEWDDVLSEVTILGHPAKTDSGKALVGETIDDPGKLLSPRERQLVHLDEQIARVLLASSWRDPGAVAEVITLRFARLSRRAKEAIGRMLLPAV